jgi:hypothetical protein
MNFGGPEFVLAIIAMAMFAGVLKTAVRAKHGLSDPHPHAPPYPHAGGRKGRSSEVARLADENAGLREENARLSNRLETYEDRLIVLERIVTDRGYGIAAEIEALRDRRGASDESATRDSERSN